jgi:hypothetical protein
MAQTSPVPPTGLWRVIRWVNITLILATLMVALLLAALIAIEHPTTKVVPLASPINGTGGLLSGAGCVEPKGVFIVGVATGQPAVNCTAGTMIVWDKPPSALLLLLNGIIIPLGLLMTGTATLSLALKWWTEKRKEEVNPVGAPAPSEGR